MGNMTGSSWRRTGFDEFELDEQGLLGRQSQHGQVLHGDVEGRRLGHGQVRFQHEQHDADVRNWGIEEMAQLAIDNHDVVLWLKISEYRIWQSSCRGSAEQAKTIMKTTDRISKLDLGSIRDWAEFSRNWINELHEVPDVEPLFHWAAVSGRQRYGYLPDGFDAHGSTLLEKADEQGDNVGPMFDELVRAVERALLSYEGKAGPELGYEAGARVSVRREMVSVDSGLQSGGLATCANSKCFWMSTSMGWTLRSLSKTRVGSASCSGARMSVRLVGQGVLMPFRRTRSAVWPSGWNLRADSLWNPGCGS